MIKSSILVIKICLGKSNFSPNIGNLIFVEYHLMSQHMNVYEKQCILNKLEKLSDSI